MASTMATAMTIFNAKKTPIATTPQKPIPKPITTIQAQTLKTGLTKNTNPTQITTASTAIAGAIFTTLSSMGPAIAAQQIAEIAENDNRGLALLLPIIPAIGWVLYNILQPALNQFNRMRSERAVAVGLGLGLGALGLKTQDVWAIEEIAKIGENSSGSDNRGLLLLIVVLPAIGWVLFNILQPALNQLNRMRSQ
ncbi:hypothetical protein RND81_07G200100 [Saponaria officinalis]|uniref:Photosystem II core complex proteins psbY, chloroplastic n=1 Tax=Saponaria officinalis TaxID=3572 RepID=A0AAW1JTM7_SAPOF